jgi:tetrahydromethanopterin S-methyltransferase subunit D
MLLVVVLAGALALVSVAFPPSRRSLRRPTATATATGTETGTVTT